jgi:cytochrome c553
MPAVIKGLSDGDIAALASYIEGLHAADAARRRPQNRRLATGTGTLRRRSDCVPIPDEVI